MAKLPLALALTLAACQGAALHTSTTDEHLTSCVDLVANGDATIASNQMTKNFGAERTLRLNKHEEALVGFDLSSIPPEASIDSATLSLYISSIGCDDAIEVHAATASWLQANVTYQSFSQHFDAAVTGSIVAAHGNVRKSVDVGSLVRSWVTGATPNDGVLLTGIVHGEATLVSREGGTAEQRPTLHVCYTVPDNHCLPNPCLNGAGCENNPTDYTCHCAPGFDGTNCEHNIDDCASNPCQHGGTCTDGANRYTCGCAPGYDGANCEHNIDECAAAPCQNGGVCEDGIASYTCHCAAGFDGASCEHNIDDCASDPCQNGGTCTDGINGYTCACATGFTGASCEINIDDCAANPCHNGGSCVDGIASYTCTCPPDWGGTTCDINLNTCAQNPCLNGASCTNGYGTYTCTCAAGFTGGNCEIDIDDCAVNLCENGGQCVDGVNSFTCACPAGLGGELCDDTLTSWVHASAGAGQATVVWGAIGNATSYVVAGDNPARSVTTAACDHGVCGVQLGATDGDSHFTVTAVNGLGSASLGSIAATATAGAPQTFPFVSVSTTQSAGQMTTTFFWEGQPGDVLDVLELDPSTGAETLRLSSTVADYDPFSCIFCGFEPPPAVYCEFGFECFATLSNLPTGAHVLQLALRSTANIATARSLPLVTIVPAVDTTPPPVPTGLHVQSATDTTVTLAWNKSTASDTASYTIKANTAGRVDGSGFVSAGACNATTCTGTIANLHWGWDYGFTVSASDAANNSSGDSAQVHGVLGGAGALSAPTIISLTPDDGMLHLRFSAPGAERPGKFHVLYRPSGGAEQDLVVLEGSCNLGNINCQLWITGLSATSYTVQIQSEGAPGNFSPRSAAVAAAPAPNPIGYTDFDGCLNNGFTKVKVEVQMPFDTTWARDYFPPDLSYFVVRITAAFLVLDSEGRWTGTYSYTITDTSLSAATICDAARFTCIGTVSFPSTAYTPASGVSVIAVDNAGNALPFLGAFSIGYPGTAGTLCQNGNF